MLIQRVKLWGFFAACALFPVGWACGIWSGYERVWVLKSNKNYPQWMRIDDPRRKFDAVQVFRKDAPAGYVPAQDRDTLKNWFLKKKQRAGQVLSKDEVMEIMGSLHIGIVPGNRILWT